MAKIGSETYVFVNRSDAANFAAKVVQARQEAGVQKRSRVSAKWEAFKSRITRSVTIPNATTVSEFKALEKVAIDIESLIDKSLCNRKPSVHDLPSDFQWSKGCAKTLTRHIVVRHWLTPGLKNSSIHSGLSMKDSELNTNEYASWAPYNEITPNYWADSNNPLKRFFAPLRDTLSKYRVRDFPDIPNSYRQEKSMYIGTATQMKLEDGEQAREDIERSSSSKQKTTSETKIKSSPNPDSTTDIVAKYANSTEVTDRTIKKASYKPLPFQKKSSKSGWQRRAMKHYLPCIGYTENNENKKRKYVLFGLDMDQMLKTWSELRENNNRRHYFKMFSKKQNCSGMCLSLLKAGGSDRFSKINPRVVTTQTDLERYADTLVEELDYLNHCTDYLDSLFSHSSLPNNPDISLEEVISKLKSVHDRFSISRDWKKKINSVIQSIKKYRATTKTVDQLTQSGKEMVTAIAELFDSTKASKKITELLTPALYAYQDLQTSMIEAYEEERSNYVSLR